MNPDSASMTLAEHFRRSRVRQIHKHDLPDDVDAQINALTNTQFLDELSEAFGDWLREMSP